MAVGEVNYFQLLTAKCEPINFLLVTMSHHKYAWHVHTTFRICFDGYHHLGYKNAVL